jgi:hypothetical protein
MVQTPFEFLIIIEGITKNRYFLNQVDEIN